jgi:hypothetical protein
MLRNLIKCHYKSKVSICKWLLTPDNNAKVCAITPACTIATLSSVPFATSLSHYEDILRSKLRYTGVNAYRSQDNFIKPFKDSTALLSAIIGANEQTAHAADA